MDEKMDQISGLPEIILHDILSRLPKKDAIKTSILSKNWREISYNFPILSVCDRGFIRRFSNWMEDQQIKAFLDHGKQRLLRFSDQGLPIKEFKLKLSLTSFFDLQRIYPDVDQWLKLACECGVQTLQLCLPTLKKDDQCLCYILHPGVIEARSLNRLVLKGRIRFHKEFLNPSLKFSSLCVLSLCYVLFDNEDAIEHVISRFPLNVYNPRGAGDMQISFMKSLSLHGLQKLKGVDIQGVQKVYIDAPNIEKIYYGAVSNEPSKINFDNCGNLRALTLMNMKNEFICTDYWFFHLFSNYPFLESLELVECSMFGRINISSAQLKALVLSNCSTMWKLEVDTPNLLSFQYYYAGDDLPSISLLRCSSQLEVNVLLDMSLQRVYQLGKFVEQFKPQKFLTSFSLSIRPWIPSDERICYDWEDPYLFPPILPVPIKHLVIHSVQEIKFEYSLLVNRLFNFCCPETISLSLNPSHCTKAFIEFLYLMIMETKKEKVEFCFSCRRRSKCWLHGLKDVKVTSSVKNDVNVVDFVHLKSLLGGLSSSDNANISFRLK